MFTSRTPSSLDTPPAVSWKIALPDYTITSRKGKSGVPSTRTRPASWTGGLRLSFTSSMLCRATVTGSLALYRFPPCRFARVFGVGLATPQ